MLNQQLSAIRERSSIISFVVLFLIGAYLIFLVVSVPYQWGRLKGEVDAAYAPPKKADAAEEEVFDERNLAKPTAELIALGARVYGANCAACHGADGLGNGAAGQGLTVAPRNFHVAGGWKNGAGVVGMRKTLVEGITPAMPAFNTSLNPRQRMAVIHYIHEEFMKEIGWPETTAEEVASLPGPAAATTVKIDPYKENRIPILLAMRNLTQQAPQAEVTMAAQPRADESIGKVLYEQNCAQCHGADGAGMGGQRIKTVSELARSSSLLHKDASWARNYSQFRSIVAHGYPNGIMPGFGTMSESQMQAVYDYTMSLRGED